MQHSRKQSLACLAVCACLCIFAFANAPLFAQAGGATALPPNPDQLASNQLGANWNLSGGNFTGYSYHAGCASIQSSVVYPGDSNAMELAGCAPNLRVFDVPFALHNHEAWLVRWEIDIPSGSLANGLSTETFDNNHGGGTGPGSVARDQQTVSGPTGGNSGWVQNFVEYYPNIAEHGSDTSLDERFSLETPAWAANTSYALGAKIVDANGNVEQVTTAGTSGASAPSWNATIGGTTTDGTATWTNEQQNVVYVSRIEIDEEWFPLRSFLLYPNYRGYLWSDLVPPKRFTQIQPVSAGSPFWNMQGSGSAPVAGEIMGVTTIDPPPGDTLSQLTLKIVMATSANCSTGVLATDTFTAPQSVQSWQFTPSQYGSLSVGAQFWICPSLYVTSGLTLIDNDVVWTGFYENAAFRATLENWYDPNSVWMHNQSPAFLLGTYDRWSATFRANTTIGQSTDQDYIQGIGSLGPVNAAPQAINSPSGGTRQNGSFITDYCSQGFSGTMSSFSTFSGINPSLVPPNDTLTPYLKVFSEFCQPMTHWQILNNWTSCLVGESASPCTTPPTFAPTVTASTGGTITANYLFLEAVAFANPNPAGNSPARLPENTLPSSPLTVNLSSSACAGANCSVNFTMPTCPTTRWEGWNIFAATGSTSTPPANSSFAIQYPLGVSGMLGSGGDIPCGASVTLSNVQSGAPPPTTDTTYQFRPIGGSGTDPQIWGQLFNLMTAEYPQSAGGMYMCDECGFYSYGSLWEQQQTLLADNLNLPLACVFIGPEQVLLGRYICDLTGYDPYGYNASPGPDEYVTGEASTQNCNMYSQNSVAAAQPRCFPSRVDIWADDEGRQTFGARPSWMVVQQFGSGNYDGFPYAEMKKQMWKAIIDVQAYGSLGADAITWGWVDSSGLESSVFASQGGNPLNNNPQAWFGSKRATNEIRSLEPVLLTPVVDSPVLGLGGIVSTVSSSVSAATACNVTTANAPYLYTQSSLWPDAPANFVTHFYTVPGTAETDQYIFANNLCSAASPFTETFTLANPPAGAASVEVLGEGRSLPITSNQFSDTWQQTDVHIYVIRAPRAMTIH